MAGRKINIFYLISLICILILIAYIWLVITPQIYGCAGQESIFAVILLITVLLSVAAGIQLFLLISSVRQEE